MRIETERLTITEITINEAPFFYELVNDPTYLQFIPDKNIKSIADAKKHITNKIIKEYESQGFGFYLVSLKDSKTPIGMCGLIDRDGLEFMDIGFSFLKEYQGKGFAFESSKGVLDFAKSTLKIDKIAAITTLDNVKSSNLLERLGFKHERNIFIPNDPDELRLFINDLS
ncbi:MAG: hypothetical protein COA67_06130 [Lutibacter sp.]|nr:MAG: hypothetical protein COA67_06130 [Lutibacter sp.]